MVFTTVNQERAINILKALLNFTLCDLVPVSQLGKDLLTDDEIFHRTLIVYTESREHRCVQ